MKGNPTVTIVTPSFNQARYLEETLKSVLAQRAEIHEYMVLDGGSADGSAEIIRAHAKDLDYWHSRPDAGQAAAIDEGIRMASGDLVCWVNSDDVLMPGAIAKVKEEYRRGQKRVITGCGVVIDADSKVMRVRHVPRQTSRWAAWGVLHVTQPACYFERSLYSEVGGLDRTLGCVLDSELWLRMLKVEPVWGHVADVIAGFRVHSGAKGRTLLDQYRREHEQLDEMHPEFSSRGMKAAVGRWMYKAREVAAGRYATDTVASLWWRGRLWTEVWGSVPCEQETSEVEEKRRGDRAR